MAMGRDDRFGAAQATTQAGTPVKFNVVNGTDQMVKNGISTTVNTRHQSITVMKEYEAKSFEELRCEDYTLGRKTGPSTSGGLFSGTTATTTSSSTGGLFGSNTSSFSPFPQTKTGFGTAGGSLFGQTNQQSGGLFGSKPGGLFGTSTATTSTPAFGSTFGSTQASGGLFGQSSNTGQTGGLFGATTTTQSGGIFGSANTGFGQSTTGTGVFGQTGFGNAQQQSGLFNNKLGTGSTFGSSTSGSLFGNQNKPTTSVFGGLGAGTGFGSAANSSLFGKPAFGTTNALNTGFGTAGSSLFGSGTNTGLNTGGNILGSGLGTQTGFGTAFAPTGTALNLGANTLLGSQNNSLGLAQQQQQQQLLLHQQILALNNSPFGDSKLFRNSLNVSFGTAFAPTGTALNLGANTLLGSQNNSLGLAQQQQQQQLLLHQQILALNNSPFGDSKLFRNSLNDKTSKALTTTTASSQHVLGSPSHYKVSSKLTAKIKPRPINYHTMNKSKLFEGLDDETGLSPDTFVPRKSVKKLIIKSKTAEEKVCEQMTRHLKIHHYPEFFASEVQGNTCLMEWTLKKELFLGLFNETGYKRHINAK
ncbi:nuclear pore complex protein Nup98-Nup96 [Exaiptasia diaphana]|uniref:Nuclear pore complex protein Nup98-Nup96 n=1 Tax=Exaiptasia diaphana TaxID=2652724 RepID=A0A913YS29_EXADI|nr:nuclear pore complex protein Nup98-Nup96 [Exaiptasia diaphana]